MLLRTVAAPAALLAMLTCAVGARAQVAVTDTVLGDNSGQTATNTSKTATATQNTYAVFTESQSTTTQQFQDGDTGTDLNPMPDSTTVMNDLKYSLTAPETTSDSNANTIYQNNYGNTDTGQQNMDPEAIALRNIVYTAANIQGMAIDNLKALQDRLNELTTMNGALASAKNITEIAAINGRIAVEALAVQAQQAQAANLTALATAQSELDITNREQAARQEHQNTISLFQSGGFSLSSLGTGG